MRIATFNLENLFTRPSVFAVGSSPEGRQAIQDFDRLNRIIAKAVYDAQDRAFLLEASQRHGFHQLNAPPLAFVRLQKIRGQLFSSAGGNLQVAAGGRDEWTGWFELRRDNVGWEALRNTAQVVEAVAADVLVCVEVEDRLTLERFNRQVLDPAHRYPHAMLIDGNDSRGIDVGLLSRHPIRAMVSHIDDPGANGERVFSRDCPEYDLELPGGETLVVIPNHFKSKRGGDSAASRERRRRQGERAHEIARTALARSPLVLVAGDLNDTPDSEALQEVLSDGFADVQAHPDYPTDRPGTFGTGLARDKIDYLIQSPQLGARLRTTGLERRGTYHPQLWASFPGVTADTEASDHHALWADFDL
ncbi:MAG TPA: endonuclease/exonuclease/phosphatase family protein [Planctomycetota bacterium]